MRKKLENTLEKLWKSITSERMRRLYIIGSILSVLIFITSYITKSLSILNIALFLLCFTNLVFGGLYAFKQMEEDRKQKNKGYISTIEKMLGNENQVEVRINSKFHETDYIDDYIKLLDMLEFLQENSNFKIYAKFHSSSGILTLYIKENENTGKELAEFPHELFCECFEPVK